MRRIVKIAVIGKRKGTVTILCGVCLGVLVAVGGCEKLKRIDSDKLANAIIESDTTLTFTLGQNIPNPAQGLTTIGYSIPKAGEVIFNIYTVSGQVLHTDTLQSRAGRHVIELNTSSFASGVYFYSIEYQGQKLVKRLIVQN